MCISPVTYIVLCVRFVSLVHVCHSQNRLQRSVGHATLDTGGWLGLMNSLLNSQTRTFTLQETTSFACRTLPDIMVSDDGTMAAYHKPIAKVKHRNVGHKQHARPTRLYGGQPGEI